MPLHGRWQSLWKRLGAQGNCEDIFKLIVDFYTEPGRAYHTLEHIEHCLREFDEVAHLSLHPDEVEFALWFHDIMYNPRTNDNENTSAMFAKSLALIMKLERLFSKRVARLIRTTKHFDIPEDLDEKLVVDIDLTIFGRPEDEFDEYERNIRREYQHVAEMKFKAKRASILKELRARSGIYWTPYFRKKYERQARKNIQRALARLAQ